jgi:hypothetical protein
MQELLRRILQLDAGASLGPPVHSSRPADAATPA